MALPSSSLFGFPGTPDPGERYRSPRRLAKVLTGLYVLELAASALLAVLMVKLVAMIRALQAGQPISEEGWLALVARYEDLQTSLFAVGLLAIVGLMVWTYRVTANAAALGGAVSHSPGWAAASYIVPVLNWWRPYMAVAEAWDASEPLGAGPDRRGGRGLLAVWWAAFLLSGWSNFFQHRASETEDLSAWLADATISLIAIAFQVVATALTIAVVVRVSRRQDERFNARIPAATVV